MGANICNHELDNNGYLNMTRKAQMIKERTVK